MNKLVNNNELARFSNDFAENAEIGFTEAKQLILFLALVSQTNPHDAEEDMIGILNVKDIASLTRKNSSKKSGSIYKETKQLIEKMLACNYVRFTPSVDLKDEEARKHLKDYSVIFDRLKVMNGGEGTFYQYRFHEDMRTHIKILKDNFVSMNIPKGMRSGHAVRFLMLAKAHHDKYRIHKSTTELTIAVKDLKQILGIADKYPVFKNFRVRVITPIISEINDSGMLCIQHHEYIKTSRSITHIKFFFQDGKLYPKIARNKSIATKLNSSQPLGENFIPTIEEENDLKAYQYIAYQYLVDRGVVRGIAYRQIVPNTPSVEFEGWEDKYFKYAWELFESRTKYKQAKNKAGAFVKWYMSGEFKNRHFSEIMEKVQALKKDMAKNDPQRWENRHLVKNMSYVEFSAWYKQQQEEKRGLRQEQNNAPDITKKIESIATKYSTN